MEEESKLLTIITTIQSKSPAYWVRLVLFWAFILYMIFVCFNYTLITVSVVQHDGISKPSSIYGTSDGHVDDDKLLTFGNFVVAKRDTIALRVAVDGYQTNKLITKPPIFGVESVLVDIYKDHDVDKYSGDSLGCVTYDPPSDTLLSYKCTNPENLVHYDNPTNSDAIWQNRLIARLSDGASTIAAVHPFAGGAIGLLQPTGGDSTPRNLLQYVDSTGKKQRYNLPVDYNLNELAATSIVTDTESITSKNILLVANSGDIFLGTIDGTNIAYKRFSMSDYSSAFDSLVCGLLADEAYCYVGAGVDPSDSAIETTYDKNRAKATIQLVDFSSDTPTLKKYTLLSATPFSKLYVTQSKKIYAISQDVNLRNNINSLEISGSDIVVRPFVSGIDATGTGSGVYYIKNNSLYEMDDQKNESYQVFSSSHVKLSNVMVFGNTVFVNGFISDVPDQKLHTYKILDKPSIQATGERLVDVLPFFMKGTTTDVDYKDTFVRIRAFATPTSDRITGRTTYDEAEYQKNVFRIKDNLTSLGITPKDYTIIYSK
jgi:hypothetical protein